MNRDAHSIALAALAVVAALTLAACGDSDSVSVPEPGPVDPGPVDPGPVDPGPVDPGPVDPSGCDGVEFESTFDAVQQVVFDGYGCTNGACHGSETAAGGLDLTAGNSWANLHDVPATISSDLRVLPGAAARSVLYQKLAAATLGEPTAGSPMPVGGEPLSEDDLNLVRWWIYGGAPETGVVLDAAPFVPGCLPDPEPLEIKPLAAPAPEEGLQFEMPSFELPPGLEVERCFAAYYDVCEQIPDHLLEFSPFFEEEVFAFDARELRMDPGSHHLILWYSFINPDQLDDPSLGGFTCSLESANAGEACDPLDLTSCGEGTCISQYEDGFGCLGYGPPTDGRGFLGSITVGGAQQAQDFVQYPEGVFNQIPCRGVFLWNPHAFNLTTGDQTTHARLNYYYPEPDGLVYRNQGGLVGLLDIFKANNPPFTKETFCSDFVVPRGGRLYEMSSHTHKHGERFWVELSDGSMIYENFVYNDPDVERYDPPLEFDMPEEAARTLRYCATYNNGVNPDGSPNVETVTRASRVPESARVPGVPGQCRPSACVNAGMVGESCNGEDDDAACDSSPGAGDGDCDACSITGGESTENEMFLLLPAYYVVPVG